MVTTAELTISLYRILVFTQINLILAHETGKKRSKNIANYFTNSQKGYLKDRTRHFSKRPLLSPKSSGLLLREKGSTREVCY